MTKKYSNLNTLKTKYDFKKSARDLDRNERSIYSLFYAGVKIGYLELFVENCSNYENL